MTLLLAELVKRGLWFWPLPLMGIVFVVVGNARPRQGHRPRIMDAIMHALSMAFAMGWEILWPLILGFTLSGVVQAVVSHSEADRVRIECSPFCIEA